MVVRRRLWVVCAIAALAACGRMEQSSRARPGDGAVIYQATILTMDPQRPVAEAVIVKDGAIVDLGSIDDLVQAYSGASFDERFLRKTLTPAFVDVRLPPNDLRIVEIPCQGDVLMEDVLSMGAGGVPLRIVTTGRLALSAALEAVQALPEDAAIGRISIEVRGPVSQQSLEALAGRGVALILSAEPAPEDCDGASSAEETDVAPASGRIALALSADSDAYLAAAGRLVEGDDALRLAPREALEAVTSDAAYALAADTERGVLAPGRRAEFAVLDRNPMATPGAAWGAIGVSAFTAED